MHEVFEHTADLGLRIQNTSLEKLLEEAGIALFELLVVNLHKVQPRVTKHLTLEQKENDLLLFDWLNELLFQFEVEKLVFSKFHIERQDTVFSAVLSGEPLDASRHQLDHEVKAITYHGLKVEQLSCSEWLAEVILDI
ncbi:MAG TPA: archease [Gemmatales bacterium]|nr:archease [Gemmatales bacterium]HMP17688.1 archease [Gemmatales bacterium]